jgi:hypothetical protein
MSCRLGVHQAIRQSVQAFVKQEALPIEVVSNSECTVQVVPCPSGRHLESDLSTLQAGGWIACETARTMASKLGIDILEMGKLLDHLDIRVRQCGLGCF